MSTFDFIMIKNMFQRRFHVKCTKVMLFLTVVLFCAELVRVNMRLDDLLIKVKEIKKETAISSSEKSDAGENQDSPARNKRDISCEEWEKQQEAAITELEEYAAKFVQAIGALQMEQDIPGPRGPPGPKGQKGMPGPKGDPGPEGNSTYSPILPSASIVPSELTVNESESAIFYCSAEGYPQPHEIVWSKMNGPLPMDRAEVDKDGDMILRNVSLSDTGKYQCTASSFIGKALVNDSLKVKYSPRLQSNNLKIHTKILKELTLPACPVHGYPEPNITWSKASGSISWDRATARNGRLALKKVKREDIGLYICKAENLLGSVSATIEVIEIPTFTEKPKSMYLLNYGERITMPCNAESKPKPVITWEKNGSTRLPYGTHVDDAGSLVLININYKVEGWYTCSATNARGGLNKVKTLVGLLHGPY